MKRKPRYCIHGRSEQQECAVCNVMDRVRRRMPNVGAELSAMHGWRIVDYTDQHNPVALNRGCKTELGAWQSVDRRGVVR
jgi:hypothetical protein